MGPTCRRKREDRGRTMRQLQLGRPMSGEGRVTLGHGEEEMDRRAGVGQSQGREKRDGLLAFGWAA